MSWLSAKKGKELSCHINIILSQDDFKNLRLLIFHFLDHFSYNFQTKLNWTTWRLCFGFLCGSHVASGSDGSSCPGPPWGCRMLSGILAPPTRVQYYPPRLWPPERPQTSPMSPGAQNHPVKHHSDCEPQISKQTCRWAWVWTQSCRGRAAHPSLFLPPVTPLCVLCRDHLLKASQGPHRGEWRPTLETSQVIKIRWLISTKPTVSMWRGVRAGCLYYVWSCDVTSS